MDKPKPCDYCAGATHDLLDARGQSNRIRMSTQAMIKHVTEILDVALSDSNPASALAAAKNYLRIAHRDLDKLPKN